MPDQQNVLLMAEQDRLAKCVLLAQGCPLLCKFRKHCSPDIKINYMETGA